MVNPSLGLCPDEAGRSRGTAGLSSFTFCPLPAAELVFAKKAQMFILCKVYKSNECRNLGRRHFLVL